MSSIRKYNSFKTFYPYYLSEHADSTNRLLHFTGTAILICCLIIGIITSNWRFFVAVPLVGYGFAWVGNFL